MADVAAWTSCIGAWLLVGGAAHQAALDLQAERELGDRIEAVKRASNEATDPVSRWWLLIPPLYLAKRHRRSEELRLTVVLDLDDDEHLRLMRYLNQAFGWMAVGLGGVLLAVAATIGLGEDMGWSGPVIGAVAAGAAVVTSVTIAGQTRRTERGHGRWRQQREERARAER